MCQREGLHQIDLLGGSGERVTEGEYWVKRRGQAELSAGGKPTKFETDKEKLRNIIRSALSSAKDFDEFAELLLREGVTVKKSRGRLSYLTSDRSKPITARRLGDDFDLPAINAVFEQKSLHLARNGEQGISSRPSILDQLQTAKTLKINTYHDSISRMVDVTPDKGVGFEHWAKVFNLKQSANSLAELERYGFESLEDLQSALAIAKTEESECRENLKAVETELYDKKELQKRVLAYANTKPIRDEYSALKSDKAKAKYREKHESEFIIMDSAQRYFKDQGIK